MRDSDILSSLFIKARSDNRKDSLQKALVTVLENFVEFYRKKILELVQSYTSSKMDRFTKAEIVNLLTNVLQQSIDNLENKNISVESFGEYVSLIITEYMKNLIEKYRVTRIFDKIKISKQELSEIVLTFNVESDSENYIKLFRKVLSDKNVQEIVKHEAEVLNLVDEEVDYYVYSKFYMYAQFNQLPQLTKNFISNVMNVVMNEFVNSQDFISKSVQKVLNVYKKVEPLASTFDSASSWVRSVQGFGENVNDFVDFFTNDIPVVGMAKSILNFFSSKILRRKSKKSMIYTLIENENMLFIPADILLNLNMKLLREDENGISLIEKCNYNRRIRKRVKKKLKKINKYINYYLENI